MASRGDDRSGLVPSYTARWHRWYICRVSATHRPHTDCGGLARSQVSFDCGARLITEPLKEPLVESR